MLMAGLHGNEPAGIAAVRRLLATLERHGCGVRGRVEAVAGNLAALAVNRRFIDQDLNRLWTARQVAALDRSRPEDDDTERREQRALLAILRARATEAAAREQPLVMIDLHSTSGPSVPFSIINDTLRSRQLATATRVPLILGLEESVSGTLLDFAEDQGHAYVLFEGGEHRHPETAVMLEAAVWRVLVALDVVRENDVPGLDDQWARLAASVRAAPRLLEVTYRHEVPEGNGFRMLSGHRGFEKVSAGQVVAEDRHGGVAIPADGVLLLPLYQDKGDDGFFLARAVGRGWLAVSFVLRRLGAARLLPWLPGVTRDPRHEAVLLVNPRVARWFVVEIFHLAGYRRLPARDGRLVFRLRARR